jgi:V/A-type H+-transporting ATPase subunit K
MDPTFDQAGAVCAMTLAAVGSSLGAGAAGMAAIGAWKRCLLEKRPMPFLVLVFVGAPLTQTLYGFIIMNALSRAAPALDPGARLFMGVFGGLALGMSAWLQGKAAAAASDALCSTGQGFGNYIMVLGIIETVALFVMVFLLQASG